MYWMTGAGRWRRILNTGHVKEQVWLMIIWSVYLYFFCRLTNGNFCAPQEAFRLDIYKCIFFLLIYRKRKFCAEPMLERLTFHFGLRTRSGNFRFFFLFFFSPFFLFFQIKARSHLVTPYTPAHHLAWCLRLRFIVCFLSFFFTFFLSLHFYFLSLSL